MRDACAWPIACIDSAQGACVRADLERRISCLLKGAGAPFFTSLRRPSSAKYFLSPSSCVP
jgi:hypothetical protein